MFVHIGVGFMKLTNSNRQLRITNSFLMLEQGCIKIDEFWDQQLPSTRAGMTIPQQVFGQTARWCCTVLIISFFSDGGSDTMFLSYTEGGKEFHLLKLALTGSLEDKLLDQGGTAWRECHSQAQQGEYEAWQLLASLVCQPYSLTSEKWTLTWFQIGLGILKAGAPEYQVSPAYQ